LDTNNTVEEQLASSPGDQRVDSSKTSEEKKTEEKPGVHDDAVDAAESLASIHKMESPTSTPPTVPPEKRTNKNVHIDETKPTQPIHSEAAALPGNMYMASLCNNFLKKDTSSTSSSVAALLNSFHSSSNFVLPGGASAFFKTLDDEEDSNPLSTVISALNRAEAIGGLTINRGMDVSRSSVTATPSIPAGGTTDDILIRLQQHRASAIARKALIEEAMKISCEGNACANDDSYMNFLQGKRQNELSAGSATLSTQALLQQLYSKKQQHQQQDPHAGTDAAAREIANQRVAQLMAGSSNPFQRQNNEVSTGVNNQALRRLLSESGNFANNGWSGLPVSALNMAKDNTDSAGRSDILLEKLRLEEGIQTLMRERVRLEAAAILEERERRRTEYLAMMQL
jgi:hypothetical protein